MLTRINKDQFKEFDEWRKEKHSVMEDYLNTNMLIEFLLSKVWRDELTLLNLTEYCDILHSRINKLEDDRYSDM